MYKHIHSSYITSSPAKALILSSEYMVTAKHEVFFRFPARRSKMFKILTPEIYTLI